MTVINAISAMNKSLKGEVVEASEGNLATTEVEFDHK